MGGFIIVLIIDTHASPLYQSHNPTVVYTIMQENSVQP